jgi:hypothetical protein
MTTRGQIVWEWRSWEHLDPQTEVITPQDHRHEWTHGNTVAELPDGNLVLSFRNVSTVCIVDHGDGLGECEVRSVHREGERGYGKTEQGEFMMEAEARKAGYRPAEEGAAGQKSATRAPGSAAMLIEQEGA